MASAFSIPGVNTTSNSLLADSTARTPSQVLGQDDFLKLLVTQMSQQDPMNPVKDMEFIAQMASFSALEQSKSMQQDMAQLRAGALLNQTVTVKSGRNEIITGVVDLVEFQDGKPSLVIGGTRYGLDSVLNMRPPVAPQEILPPTTTE
jgi:flagellar basal-body rod modification protein FlgD